MNFSLLTELLSIALSNSITVFVTAGPQSSPTIYAFCVPDAVQPRGPQPASEISGGMAGGAVFLGRLAAGIVGVFVLCG